ncbi:4-coumarate--CoA ligase-like 9 isoform X2 [Salvia splendens]|uniref:4-coumarate--CoA ligase-like 9 isoform X2 n=1 Tax=Salvia splendens TaxID=180675 RepID=UPI001C27A45E|nr:4-coumarate--CoA ligase-like 9 isoform X2 [Salvia splendens]
MAETQSTHSTDPKSGYCSATRIYHSLLPPSPLPPPSSPLSISSYALSLLHSPANPTSASLSTTAFLIDSDSGDRLTYSAFLQRVTSLSSSLTSLISMNDVSFVLSPPSFHIPVLYFSLLSLGVAISPSNPLASPSELAQQIQLSKPSIAFTTSALAHKIPPNLPVVLLDSPEFLSMLQFRSPITTTAAASVKQSDPAAVLYSSGTTGKVKAVVLTHRNLIAVITGYYHKKLSDDVERGVFEHPVSLFTLPLFHVFGFFMLISAAAIGESLVLMGKFDFVKMLEAVQRYRVMYIPVAPPVIVAMVKSDLVDKYDLSSLQLLGSGGAPLGEDVAERFKAKFPDVDLIQGYGMTETAGGVTRSTEPDEVKRYGSVGRLAENMEAKIVDPESGESLTPGQRGELWLRGPAVMKGDEAATAATLDPEGWLKTGDLCYFDSDGLLYIVDRLKELIKYKGYQVPPAELEHLLQSIPQIADAAVIPYPDEEAGQIPMAYVVRKPGATITSSQLMELIAKQVAPYKKIRRVAFVDAIPKSPAGKILRRELVRLALSASSSKL